MKIVLACVLLLLCLAGLIWMLAALGSEAFTFLSAFWKSRSGFNPARPSGRWRLLGLALTAGGILYATGREDWLLHLLAGFAVAYVGFRCFGRAKRYEARTAEKVLGDDARAPVLYLRSFGDDARVSRRLGMAGFRMETEESELAEILRIVGPFVAIGRPGEPTPWAGAARMYVGEKDWQDCVGKLMSGARLVIVRAGDTAGLWWEVAESVRRVKPEKLVFLIPLNRSGYQKFRAKAEEYLPCRLPEYQGRYNPVTTIRSVLYFDRDWAPHLLPVQETVGEYMWNAVQADSFWHEKQSKLQRVLIRTFQPVLESKFEQGTNGEAVEIAAKTEPAGKTPLRAATKPPRRAARDARGRFQKSR